MAFNLGNPRRASWRGYTAPTLNHPHWTVAYLVFQGGIPRVRIDSLTGGGQVYGHEFRAFDQPVLMSNSAAIVSLVGGGQIPTSAAELQALMGGVVAPSTWTP